jgi:hypothetical protein
MISAGTDTNLLLPIRQKRLGLGYKHPVTHTAKNSNKNYEDLHLKENLQRFNFSSQVKFNMKNHMKSGAQLKVPLIHF